MGQYLAIGVSYEIHMSKADSVKHIDDLESLKNELNQKYNPTGLYDFIMQGDNVVLSLKDDIVLEEWTDVLETFYKLRYLNWSDDENVLTDCNRFAFAMHLTSTLLCNRRICYG